MSDKTTYKGSEMWLKDIAEAKERWKVTNEVRRDLGTPEFLVPHDLIRVVEAEADTGSRYVVITTPIGQEGASICGASIMVTVLAPWTDAWALQPTGKLHMGYIAEHLTAGRHDKTNGGDLAALTLTVAYALNREAVLV